MPQFEMPLGPCQTWQEIDSFTQGYWEAAFFTEAHGDNPDLEEATFADVAEASGRAAVADCEAFQTQHAALLARAYLVEAYRGGRVDYNPNQAGRDFWFTRNRHGVGFWDRGLGDIGDSLTDAAHDCGEVNMVRGDDGKVYLE